MRLLLALLTALAFAGGCHDPDATSATLDLPSLRVALPPQWESQPPASSMRTAQARVPGAAGDAELTVFHFGEGKGGDAASNLQRWVDQIEFVPGSSTHREEFVANGFTIYWVDFAGTLKPDPMGVGSAVAVPGTRLLGAIVEGPGGPWYFKLLGPDATVAAQREAFLRMLESVRAR